MFNLFMNVFINFVTFLEQSEQRQNADVQIK